MNDENFYYLSILVEQDLHKRISAIREGEAISEVLIEPSEQDLEAKDDPSLDTEAKDEALENLLNKETLEEEENE